VVTLAGRVPASKEVSAMKMVEVNLVIKAPIDVVIWEISEYTHPPILHKGRIKSVEVLEDKDNISIAVWRLKVLGLLRTAKQKQTVTPPYKMTNETLEGFARGTMERTYLFETTPGTRIVDRIEVRVPQWGWLLEKPVAWYSRRLAESMLMDHKRDIEARCGATQAPVHEPSKGEA
jgi:hypothetical protein